MVNPALVGRRDVLETFRDALHAAVGGAFQFLTIAGDPGIGKTRLLTELGVIAEERGMSACRGRAAEFEQMLPFGALIDALDDRVQEVESPHAPLLSRVFPSLPGPTREEAATGDDPLLRYQVYRAIRRLLEDLAEDTGLALLLDDLHWSDDATVELLEYLVRHPPRGPVLVAVAFRQAQAPARLSALRQADGREVTVGPLSPSETEELLGPDVSRSHSKALHQASGGNPFYLEALAKMGDRDHADLPASVRALLQVELDNLSPAALNVARAAAVAADEFEPALAAEAAQVSDEAILDACDELVSRDVVRTTGSGRFRFRHPLVRQVAYESSTTEWRLAAHARLAAHLEMLGAPATIRAHHVEAAARAGDEKAATTLVTAARGVAAHAPATAAHWLRVALDLLPEEHAERLDLMLELARVLSVSGRMAEGRDTTRELLRRLPPNDHAQRAEAAQLCSQLERQLDRPDEARAVLLDELQRMPSPRFAAAIPLRWRLVMESLMRVDVRAAQAVLDLMPARRDDWEPGLDIAIAAVRPMAAYGDGRIEEAVRLSEHATDLVAAAPDEHLAEWLDGIAWLCWVDVMLGRYDTAMRNIERCMAVGRSTGHSHMLGYLHCAKARLLCLLGQLPEAAEQAAEAAEVARLLGSGQQLVFALTQQCLVATIAGDHAGALRYGEEAIGSGIGGDEWWGAMARFAHGVALVLSGEIDDGMRSMLDAFRDEERPLLDPGTLVACCEIMATIEALLGRPEAAEWADRAQFLAPPELRAEVALADLARAQVLQATQPASAGDLAASAGDTLLEMGRRIDAGRALQAAGQMFLAAGRKEEAAERLVQAVKVFAQGGALSFHANAVEDLRRMGVRVPTGQEEERPFGLSRRELEIARLVADGRTNQQIATQLIISVRTVETHLNRVFAKLGVESRVGVATKLGQVDGR